MIRKLRAAIAASALMMVSACVAGPGMGGALYVRSGPPPRRVEVVTTAPGRDFVWIGGNWAWHRSAYEWLPGRWERPPRGYHAWEDGHWDHDRQGWFFVEGHWR